MKKTVICIVFMLIFIMLISCSEEPVDEEITFKPICAYADTWNGIFVYENTLFCQKNGIIRCYDLTDIEAGSYSASSDPFVNDIELYANPLHADAFVVSPKLTWENSGSPVLIMAKKYRDNEKDADFYRLYHYDTAANKVTVIKESIDYPSERTHMYNLVNYGDSVFFTLDAGKMGCDIYRINIDGSDYIKKENKHKEQYWIIGVYNDRIYYTNQVGSLYSNSLMLDDEKSICSTNAAFQVAVVANSIIYAKKGVSYVTYEDTKYESYTICRRQLDNLENEEIIFENVALMQGIGDKIYYNLCEPHHLNETFVSQWSPLYEYSFETGETRTVYDLSGTECIRNLKYVGEEYLIFTEIDYSTGDTFQTTTEKTIVHNLATGEETVLPMEE